ncbi:hypothetical protein CYMTET_27486 [Cymbomonas tetramitiformis]|uniref:Uncharacterized protein n=1 Tax=Cymbomonas tetramitiformis TaxID=36881 RepID=A0AAE0FQB7_9CHLO|nr:hypothetical protein CYMTET_27486 [Cymbomonas tetramitiformis]
MKGTIEHEGSLQAPAFLGGVQFGSPGARWTETTGMNELKICCILILCTVVDGRTSSKVNEDLYDQSEATAPTLRRAERAASSGILSIPSVTCPSLRAVK